MMDLERAETISLVLGQEFLTWLWFTTETGGGLFRTRDNEAFTVAVEQKVTVQGGEGEARETAVCSGPMAELREARAGLAMGKKVTKAKVRIEKDEAAWQVLLDAATFTLQGLKTPKVEMKLEEGEDPDARILEKIYLLEKCMDFVDVVFARFLHLRFGSGWAEETERVRAWVREPSLRS
jgi:hypothetical protein